MDSHPTETAFDRNRTFIIGWTALLPFICLVLLPLLFFRIPFTNFVPTYWDDQVSYARQMATVHAVGFEGGYYTMNERPAAAEFSHFYAHGPAFPLLYGMLGRLTGWSNVTGLLYNALFLSIGLVFFIVVASLDMQQCMWLSLIYLTWWVIQLYSVTLMQEAFHHAAALIFAGIFVRLFRDPNSIPRKAILPIILFTLFMGFMRISWMLIAVPLFLGLIPRWTLRWVITAFAGALLATGIIYFVSGWMAAPGASSITKIISMIMVNPGEGFVYLIGYMGGNFKVILETLNYNLPGLQFIQMVILMGAALFFLIRSLRASQRRQAAYWLFILYMLVSIVVLSCAFYLPAGFLRIFSLPLFTCACLMVAQRQYKLVLVVLIVNLVSVHAFVAQFQDHGATYQFSPEDVRQWKLEADTVLAYEETAPTQWCNTILVHISVFDYRVMMLPEELGIGLYTSFPETMKSRYYYTMNPMDVAGKPLLEERAAFSFGGILYENTQVRDQCLTPTS